MTDVIEALVLEWYERASDHLRAADQDDDDDVRLHNIMAGAIAGCASQLNAALRAAAREATP